MNKKFEIFVLSQSENQGPNKSETLQSLANYYNHPSNQREPPGGRRTFATQEDAEKWIEDYGESNRRYTILPIYEK